MKTLVTFEFLDNSTLIARLPTDVVPSVGERLKLEPYIPYFVVVERRYEYKPSTQTTFVIVTVEVNECPECKQTINNCDDTGCNGNQRVGWRTVRGTIPPALLA